MRCPLSLTSCPTLVVVGRERSIPRPSNRGVFVVLVFCVRYTSMYNSWEPSSMYNSWEPSPLFLPAANGHSTRKCNRRRARIRTRQPQTQTQYPTAARCTCTRTPTEIPPRRSRRTTKTQSRRSHRHLMERASSAHQEHRLPIGKPPAHLQLKTLHALSLRSRSSAMAPCIGAAKVCLRERLMPTSPARHKQFAGHSATQLAGRLTSPADIEVGTSEPLIVRNRHGGLPRAKTRSRRQRVGPRCHQRQRT